MTNGRLKWFCREILGREPILDSFDDKLIIQKTGYIAQIMGIGWNYDYGWYVRGVYSSELTVDLYDHKGKDLKYEPTEQDKKIVEKIKPLAGSLSRTEKYNKAPDAYELVSTVVFAKKAMNLSGEKEIAEFTKKAKPWFEDEHVEKAMKSAERLG
ncbi:MAG: hypothetical protein WAX07_08160 [Candidatus Altiarchaeia archaeon]